MFDKMRARKLFIDFHGMEPDEPGDLPTLDAMPAQQLVLVGNLDGVFYTAEGDGRKYVHKFGSDRPRLYVTADGKQAYILAGGYMFTERGFIK